MPKPGRPEVIGIELQLFFEERFGGRGGCGHRLNWFFGRRGIFLPKRGDRQLPETQTPSTLFIIRKALMGDRYEKVKMAKQTRLALELLSEALALDAVGRERKAIPLYRRAIARGLENKDLHTALVCLGSSLRTVGQTKAAITTLRKARRLFPRDIVVTLFLALAHYDAGQRDLAIRQLGDALLKESAQPSLAGYRRVLARKYHALRG
jgi:tetratricopeptide (TPR) repeat protein